MGFQTKEKKWSDFQTKEKGWSGFQAKQKEWSGFQTKVESGRSGYQTSTGEQQGSGTLTIGWREELGCQNLLYPHIPAFPQGRQISAPFLEAKVC